MKPVFADTSYYLALVNPNDPYRERALALGNGVLGQIFLTDYILVELGSALSRGADRAVFLNLLVDLRDDESITVIPADNSLFAEGVAWFGERPDKNWSLVDCLSFVVMKKRRLKEALTVDRHFAQAGFRALLLEKG